MQRFLFYIIALLSNGKRHLVMMSCAYQKKFQKINGSPNSSKFLAIKKTNPKATPSWFSIVFHGRHFPVKMLWLCLGSLAGFPKEKSRLVQYSTAQWFSTRPSLSSHQSVVLIGQETAWGSWQLKINTEGTGLKKAKILQRERTIFSTFLRS